MNQQNHGIEPPWSFAPIAFAIKLVEIQVLRQLCRAHT